MGYPIRINLLVHKDYNIENTFIMLISFDFYSVYPIFKILTGKKILPSYNGSIFKA